jgi:transketolase
MKYLDVKCRHDSMRGWFAYELYKQMAKDERIWLIVGDLGYKAFDYIRRDFPERFINCGAAEQAMTGIAVGMALNGKIPFVYSITTFLLYRPFETIRNYINYEKIPVKMIGGGRDKDYTHDGISHWAEEDKKVMKIFKNIKSLWPENKEEIPQLVENITNDENPWYINLKR